MILRWLKLPSDRSCLLLGSRRAGKTTLLKQQFPDATYLTLDDYDTLEASERDPKAFLGRSKRRLVIDEIQRNPRLLVGVKDLIDNHDRQVLMTGSSALRLEATGVETLAGRIRILDCPTLCWGEERGASLGKCFDLKSRVSSEQLRIADRSLEEWLEFGGYPEIVTANDIDRKRELLVDYKNSFFLRELANLNELENSRALMALMMVLARNIGSYVEVSSVSKEIGLSVPSVKKYLRALESSRIIFPVTGYRYGSAKRYIKAPKYYYRDVGIPSALGVDLSEGQRFELFAVTELEKRRLLGRFASDQLFYYESVGGREIDVIIEEKKQVYAIEIKCSRRPTRSDTETVRTFELDNKSQRLMRRIILCRAEKRSVDDSAEIWPITELHQKC